MSQPEQRGGSWWQQRPDGSWLRWNEGRQAWEEAREPPPPEGPRSPPGYAPPGPQQPGPQQPGYPPQPYPGQPYAGAGQIGSVWARIGAVLLDGLIIGLPLGLLLTIMTGGFDTSGPSGGGLSTGPGFLISILMAAYFLVMEATRGASLGKLIVGLRVVYENGSPLDWRGSAIRNVLRLVDVSFCFLIGLIAMIVSDRNQRLGDMAARTVVVRSR